MELGLEIEPPWLQLLSQPKAGLGRFVGLYERRRDGFQALQPALLWSPPLCGAAHHGVDQTGEEITDGDSPGAVDILDPIMQHA